MKRLRKFIKEKNPQAARRASDQLRRNILQLQAHPELGGEMEELPGFRELVARDYIVRYRVVGDELVILRIWHEKEDR